LFSFNSEILLLQAFSLDQTRGSSDIVTVDVDYEQSLSPLRGSRGKRTSERAQNRLLR